MSTNNKNSNIRREFGVNYTAIPSDILRDARISLKARGLYATMMGLPKDWNLSVAGLIEILKEGRDSIYNTLNELKTYGYVTTRQVNENGSFGQTEYTIHANPFDEPLTKNTDAESTDTENSKQYNNTSNTEYNNKEKNIKQEKTVSNLKERKEAFKNSIQPYVEKYGSEMCNQFYTYWTEPFVNKPEKMRFEDQKTWSIGGRLATWNNNNSKTRNYGTTNNSGVSRSKQRELETISRRAELMLAISANEANDREGTNKTQLPDEF